MAFTFWRNPRSGCVGLEIGSCFMGRDYCMKLDLMSKLMERETKKYTAAYFVKKASPTIIPHNTKFITEGFFLILSNTIIDRVQNNNKKTTKQMKPVFTIFVASMFRFPEERRCHLGDLDV